jgi:hypothetical protein
MSSSSAAGLPAPRTPPHDGDRAGGDGDGLQRTQASPPATAQSQIAQSPGFADDKHGFQFANAHSRAQTEGGKPDPCAAALANLRRASSTSLVRDILHVQGLFDGLGTEDAARDTVAKWLLDISADGRSHRVMATDPNFSLRLLAPSVVVKAVYAVALHEGWQPECLLQDIFCNVGFMEKTTTRLKECCEDTHSITPNIPCFKGASSSARKSSLKSYTSETLLAGATHAPVCVKERKCFMGDATVTGIRALLYNYGRVVVVSDEATCTYKTPFSEEVPGVNCLPRSKMNTFVHCEADHACTAKGSTHNSVYSLLHNVSGQAASAERACNRAQDLTCIPCLPASLLCFPRLRAASL